MYKRQVFDGRGVGGGDGPRAGGFGNGGIGLNACRAVSYTHLDVYKRQPIPPAPGGRAPLCSQAASRFSARSGSGLDADPIPALQFE